MYCDQCGPLEFVLMDGYPVGDRLLEGVKFQVSRVEGKTVVTALDEDAEYLAGLNTKKWMKAMQAYADHAHTDTAECPKCNGDVDWNGEKG